MDYIDICKALVVVGGRNDDVCKNQSIPYLNDIFLFLLEQKTWVNL